MSEYLFIGGDSDGKRIEVTDGMLEVRMPVRARAVAPLASYNQSSGIFHTQSYRRIDLIDGEVRYAVYMHGNVAQPIRMLIDGYGRCK